MAKPKKEITKCINDSYELPNNVKNAVPAPVVSVCIATHQHVNFIEACIDGALIQQADFGWEILVGEDCSKDGTREKVLEYADKYPDKIRVVTADYNVGQKANKQRLLLAARGKYIAPLDGDDYWTDPQKLQKQVDFLEKNPTYYMCYHSYRTMKDDKLSRIVLPKRGRDYTADELIATPGGIAVTTKLVRNIYAKPTNDDVIEFFDDYDMNMIMGTFGPCKFLHYIKPSIRRLHPGGDHTSKTQKQKLYTIANVKIRSYRYFLSKNDEHRTMIALKALYETLHKKRSEIHPDQKTFRFSRTGIQIVFGGIWFELYFKPFLLSIKQRLKKKQ